jgi:hypothetical protein
MSEVKECRTKDVVALEAQTASGAEIGGVSASEFYRIRFVGFDPEDNRYPVFFGMDRVYVHRNTGKKARFPDGSIQLQQFRMREIIAGPKNYPFLVHILGIIGTALDDERAEPVAQAFVNFDLNLGAPVVVDNVGLGSDESSF